MRKLGITMMVFAAIAAAVPAGAAQLGSELSPYGREDNALGTLRWLPKNANEAPATGRFRLVVVYDYSLNASGQPNAPLKVKGAFGVKFFTTSQADFKMVSHSAKVGDLNTLTGQNLPAQANETAAGVYGDVRDGACSKAGTSDFSAAYSTSRQFVHSSQTPYVAVNTPGACEVVTQSTEIRDTQGNLLGFDTKVTTHVPGFYIDVTWPVRTVQGFSDSGRALAEVWYGAVYDTAGDPGPFPNGADASSSSKSVYSPGDYTSLHNFTANPGATGVECVDTTGMGVGAPGSWADIKVQVPANAKKVTFMLFPKGDWDLVVIDPEGNRALAGAAGGLSETEVVPSTGSNNLPTLVPGEYTMRGCNFSGEQTVVGSVQIDY